MKTISTELRAFEIANAIISERWLKSFIIPNHIPYGWWECDVFQLTKAGYFVEYEIKTSRSDFFADQKKAKTKNVYKEGRFLEVTTVTKHELIASRVSKGPSRFFFAVPDKLVGIDEVPEWAGLISCSRFGRHWVSTRILKPAPRLHETKYSDTGVEHAKSCAYYRLHKERSIVSNDFEDGDGI